MSGSTFYGLSARSVSEERHLKFQRQSATSGNWESRERALRPIWKDMAIGIVAGLILIPPVCPYVAPYVVAALRAIAG